MHSNLESLGDCVGLESCVDLKKDLEELSVSPPRSGCGEGVGGGGRCRWKKILDREYPPPIPWLVRTENLVSHMPWVMKRYYTSDGRLVIVEEKVKRHEYFKADRSGGRLTLLLVPLDDGIHDFSGEKKVHADTEESKEDSAENRSGEMRFYDLGSESSEENQENVEAETMGYVEEGCMEDETAVVDGRGGGGGGDVEWYGCEGFGRVSCRYGMTVPSTLSPVHTKSGDLVHCFGIFRG